MQQNNNELHDKLRDELRVYRVWQRFTILQVMSGLALLGMIAAVLLNTL